MGMLGYELDNDKTRHVTSRHVTAHIVLCHVVKGQVEFKLNKLLKQSERYKHNVVG